MDSFRSGPAIVAIVAAMDAFEAPKLAHRGAGDSAGPRASTPAPGAQGGGLGRVTCPCPNDQACLKDGILIGNVQGPDGRDRFLS